ncbi:MAG TPA: hypothetical protein VHH55_00935 [Gaiellaceae bacterium]|nr:hypothetical protein [Gaiellaceae bacterium]
MTLQDDLDRIAGAAARFAAEGEELAGVLAAEPALGGRVYICAFRGGEAVTWLALDDAGEPVTERERVREAASLVALSEVAEESAGGGELDELRQRLVALRLTENPPGIDEAEEAVLGLQRILGAPPRIATARYLDEVGAATKRLEDSLGTSGASPFAEAMKASAGAVQSFTEDVERHYKAELA